MLRIVTVKPLEKYTVQVKLTDATTRILDLGPFLKGPFFRTLREDLSLFRRVRVDHGTLTWPTGQDLCPGVLLDTEIARRAADSGPE